MSAVVNDSCGNGLVHAAFNQDQGCFACAMTTGFRIYNCEPLKETHRQVFIGGGLVHVEMLFRCNYLAFVAGGARPLFPPNRLLVWDDLKKSPAICLDFNAPVLGCRLRRDRIVVILENVIKVYTFTQRPQQLHVFETGRNPHGLCELCPSSTNSLLAFPSRRNGHVLLVDLAHTECSPITVPAHETLLQCIALNSLGTRLATASERGTLVRVFDTATGALLMEFRRGVHAATIYCINFNRDSSCLCVASDHGTVHVFSLQNGILNKHSHLAKYFASNWAFCKFSIPHRSPCICAFSADNASVIVICSDGLFYKFTVQSTGDSVREQCVQFLESGDESS